MSTLNRNRVPISQWRKWGVQGGAQRVFNDIYRLVLDNQTLITHPKMERVKPFLWKTIAWNTAWLAADAVCDAAKAAVKLRGGKVAA